MDESWTLNFNEAESPAEPNHFLDNASGREVIHKRGLNLDISKLIEVMYEACDPSKLDRMNHFISYFVLTIYGKRNIRKDAIDESKLSQSQREVYNRIRTEMKNPLRRQRILNFIHQKDITKRLINYFVVRYSLMEREISYYLDKTVYPYKVIGEFNNPNQADILDRKANGEHIVWINLHQEYKTSKIKKGRRNLHAPYRRSISVRGADGNDYSLCELNFYIWLDDVGGFDLFYLFESDVREKKSKYEEEKRNQESHGSVARQEPKKKKQKIVLRQTDGRNYKTHIMKCETSAPFSLLTPTCTFSEYILHLKRQRQQQTNHVLDPPSSNKRIKHSTTTPKKGAVSKKVIN